MRSDDDVRYWLQAAREHNTWEDPDEVGEPLVVTCVLKYVTTSTAANPRVRPATDHLLVLKSGRQITQSCASCRCQRATTCC